MHNTVGCKVALPAILLGISFYCCRASMPLVCAWYRFAEAWLIISFTALQQGPTGIRKINWHCQNVGMNKNTCPDFSAVIIIISNINHVNLLPLIKGVLTLQ